MLVKFYKCLRIIEDNNFVEKNGRIGQDRTADLLDVNEALSRLSYDSTDITLEEA
jgi:hypothetical protein